ncbi:MAG: hypothetical protein IIU80_01150 [Clostridia bacterium]|nr:hypothetical protein [Clostridia bacterium]
MAFIKTTIALFLSIIMFISNGITSFIPGFIREPLSEDELRALVTDFEQKPLADEIVVVRGVSKDERAAIQSLQGLVGREAASIFINFGGFEAEAELKDLEAAGAKLLYTDENGKNWTLENLIPRYLSHIKDNGYVLYTNSDTTEQINMAFNYATVYGWLVVPQSVEERVKAIGLEKKEDLTDDTLDFTQQREFYEEHKDEFRKDVLIHLYWMASGLRDLAVQQRIFMCYVEDDDYLARTFRDRLFKDLEPASMILGWCKYEVKYTQCASRFGHYVIPSDHSFNTSILTCNRVETAPMAQKAQAPELNPDKHYVAIVYSDGDNAQWISNGYAEYHTWQSYNIDTPITWTFAPQMKEFSSTAVKKAQDNNKMNNTFISGPSGAGYARISFMSAKDIRQFADRTAATMLDSGLRIVTLLNDPPATAYDEWVYTNKLKNFAKYDNIDGGILQFDDDYYAGGHGKVYFENDKPFMSVRFSLWHPSGDAAQVNNEWLKEQAEIVNSYSADIDSINGYSVINVHPWTVGPDDLAYFVSQLDDGVEVLPAAELLAAVAENIPHKNAKPE